MHKDRCPAYERRRKIKKNAAYQMRERVIAHLGPAYQRYYSQVEWHHLDATFRNVLYHLYFAAKALSSPQSTEELVEEAYLLLKKSFFQYERKRNE